MTFLDTTQTKWSEKPAFWIHFHAKLSIQYVIHASVAILIRNTCTNTCCFYRAMHFTAKRGIAIACRLSVRPSVCNVSCALNPRSVSPLWCLSTYQSWAAQTSSSSTAVLRSMALTTVCAPVKAASTRDAWGIRGIFQLSTGRRHCAISRAMPAFISPHLWPTNSPDLNLVAYKIWSVIQQRVRAYQSRVHESDELKQCMQQVWHNIDQSIIDNAIAEWRKRFRACVQANAGHL